MTRSITQESTLLPYGRPLINRGQAERRYAWQNELAIVVEHRRGKHVKRLGTGVLRGINCPCNLLWFFSSVNYKLNSARPRRVL